jgi:DNA-directed RNA polymerase subunit RPC12/RpoP
MDECGPKPTGKVTEWEPTCPRCKAQVYGGDLYMTDGEERAMECDECGQQYSLTLRLTYDYTSVPTASAPAASAPEEGE